MAFPCSHLRTGARFINCSVSSKEIWDTSPDMGGSLCFLWKGLVCYYWKESNVHTWGSGRFLKKSFSLDTTGRSHGTDQHQDRPSFLLSAEVSLGCSGCFSGFEEESLVMYSTNWISEAFGSPGDWFWSGLSSKLILLSLKKSNKVHLSQSTRTCRERLILLALF